jgi:hypothetical protein
MFLDYDCQANVKYIGFDEKIAFSDHTVVDCMCFKGSGRRVIADKFQGEQ